ncbi:FAD-dependent oxidoreductase [uncultured Nitratireductor sp.]|uniref:NAD(P)/FAD-dependent oxidoreductase n=1 Tax=uncultured Nitratireductor sp. TaxID=520953 RepID=UPI0025E1765B|nr:FAD-dependent oxidoreductase [uncultured Nitratireductor sp.]
MSGPRSVGTLRDRSGTLDEHIIIVGAGHGGVQAAASLREEGYTGRLTLVSADPELPYHKPPLSKTFLKSPNAEPQILRAKAFYEAQDIDLLAGTKATGFSPAGHTLALSDGRQLRWTKLLLATGARPRRLEIVGADLAGVCHLRDCADARSLRSELQRAGDIVVIGGGFIGLEVAATAAMAGKQVQVVEVAERLLGRAVSMRIAEHLHAYHESLGVVIATGTGVSRIVGEAGKVRAVVTTDGRELPADLVLVGIGAAPNTALAQAAGLVCENGIRVDAQGRSSAPDVYAIGDCVSFPHATSGRRLRLESVQNATDQARSVAKAMLGQKAAFDAVAWFWSDQGERKLQMVGLPFDVDREIVTGDADSGAFCVYMFSGERLVAIETINRPGEHMLGRRMLAAGFSPTAAQISEGPAAVKAAFMGTAG